MTTIDERVVGLKFDNSGFEKGVASSLKSIDNLKKGINFDKSVDSISKLQSAGDSVDLSGMSKGISTIADRFTTLGIIGTTALFRIANQAISTGTRIVKSLTLDPVMMGFREYETQINAVQTILANTSSKGTTLNQVNSALKELNTYADKTIYNFTEMTRNIGTFTAAGLDLDVSTSAIKGIANLAAVSGSTSQQASVAMYQLSQALSSGTVKLMDWNSVVNAGMGGQVFQDALKDTARLHGVKIDEMIKKEGSFRETLSNGWLTSSILTATLDKFTGDLTEEQLISLGYTEEQTKEILKMGETANDAATKVKTFTQLMDTLQEASQSGWTETWQILIGDFDEAKKLLTEISDTVGEIIGISSDRRNTMLAEGLSSGWKQFLSQGIQNEDDFKKSLIEVAKTHEIAVDELIERNGSLEESFKEGWLSGDIMKDTLDKITEKTRNLSDEELVAIGYTRDQVNAFDELRVKLDDGTVSMDEFLAKISRSSGRENIINAIRNALVKLGEVIKPITDGFREIFPYTTGDQVYSITQAIVNFTEKIELSEELLGNIKDTSKGFFSVLKLGLTVLKTAAGIIGKLVIAAAPLIEIFFRITGAIGRFVESVNMAIIDSGIFAGAAEFITGVLTGTISVIEGFGNVLSKAFSRDNTLSMDSFKDKLSGLSDLFVSVGDKMSGFFETMRGILRSLFTKIGQAFDNLDFSNVLEAFNIGMLGALLYSIRNFFKNMSLTFDSGKGVFESISGIFDSVGKSLQAWQTNLNAKTLLTIAGALAILTVSILTLSSIDPEKLAGALGALGVMFGELLISLNVLQKISSSKGFIGMLKLTTAMISMSISVLLLSFAVKKLADIPASSLVKASGAIFVLTEILVRAANNLSKNSKKMFKGGISLILFAVAVNVLAMAVERMAGIKASSLIKGLLGVAAAVGILATFINVTDFKKIKLTNGVALLLLAAAINVLAMAVEKFAKIKSSSLLKGLGAVTILLGALAVFTRVSGDSKKIVSTGIGLTILAVGINILAKAVEKMGNLSVKQIIKGIGSITAVLLGIGIALRVMPRNMISTGIGLLIISGAVMVLTQALDKMGKMSVKQILKGLIALGGTLLLLTVAVNFMKGALGGAVAMFIVASAMVVMAGALKILGSMSISEIATALLALAGTLLVFAGLSIILAPIVPVMLALSVALAAAGVGILAFAVGMGVLIGILSMGYIALAAAIDTFILLIPKMVQAIITFLTELLVSLAEATPQIATAIVNMILEILRVLDENLPKFLEYGFNMLESIMIGIRDNLGRFIDLGVEIVVEFLNGLGNNAETIATAALDFIGDVIAGIGTAIVKKGGELLEWGGNIVSDLWSGMTSGFADIDVFGGISSFCGDVVNGVKNFFGIASPSKVFKEIGGFTAEGLALGINNKAGDATASAIDLASGVLTGMEKSLSLFKAPGKDSMDMFMTGMLSKSREMMTLIKGQMTMSISVIMSTQPQFRLAGQQVGIGFVDGMREYISVAASTAADMARAALNSAKSVLGIRSPSRVFHEFGGYSAEGYANGLTDNLYMIDSSMEELGDEAVNALKKALIQIEDELDEEEDNLDWKPKVSPVLDLDDLKNGSRNIQDLFNTGSVDVSSALGRINKPKEVKTQDAAQQKSEQSITFIQNNSSPKALSRAEIYRQTNNQFSRLKGVLTDL